MNTHPFFFHNLLISQQLQYNFLLTSSLNAIKLDRLNFALLNEFRLFE